MLFRRDFSCDLFVVFEQFVFYHAFEFISYDEEIDSNKCFLWKSITLTWVAIRDANYIIVESIFFEFDITFFLVATTLVCIDDFLRRRKSKTKKKTNSKEENCDNSIWYRKIEMKNQFVFNDVRF